jgi:hypothetical protein
VNGKHSGYETAVEADNSAKISFAELGELENKSVALV